MKNFRILMFAGLWAALPLLSRAQAPAGSQGFDAYAIVRTRNIFDPARNPYSAAYVAPRPRPVERERRSMDSVTLTGVMVNGGKAYAFFFGSRVDDDKVVPVNGEIADARVTKITTTGVEVDQAGKKLSIPVGQSLAFESSEPGGGSAPDDSGAQAAPASPSENPTQTTSPPPGNINDVMRRMMERRQQQLQ